MRNLKSRIAALEGAYSTASSGLLEYDCSTETRVDAAKGATRPGLHLVLERFDRCAGVLLEVLVSGEHRFMEGECASS